MHDIVRFERTLPFCISADNCAACADGEFDDSFDESFNLGKCDNKNFITDTNQEYQLPFYTNDIISFVVDKSMLSLSTYDSMVVGIISCCGKFVYNSVLTYLKETSTQLFIKAKIPVDIQQGIQYRFFIGNLYRIGISNVINPTSPTAHDGSFSVNISAGRTGVIKYSIDGVNWQLSPNFTGVGYGDYNVQVIEDGCLNNTYDLKFVMANCGDYSGTTIQDLIDSGVIGFQIDNCTGNDFI